MDVIDEMLYENENILPVEDEELVEEKPIKVKKVRRVPVYVYTEKRKIALQNGRDARDKSFQIKREAKSLILHEESAIRDAKFIAKAVSLKKKLIKEEYLLHINSEDDIPDNEIQRMKNEMKIPQYKPQPPPPPPPPPPQFVFR